MNEPISTLRELGARLVETVGRPYVDHRERCSLCEYWPHGDATVFHDSMGGSIRLTHPEDYTDGSLSMSRSDLIATIHKRALWGLWYCLVNNTRTTKGTTAPTIAGFDGWALDRQAGRAVAIAEHILLPHWSGEGRADIQDMNIDQLRAVSWIVGDEFENLC